MSIDGRGRAQLRILAARLKDAGNQGLRRELLRQMAAAGEPVARKIASVEHLAPYMPDRYAAVLAADLNVHVEKLLAGNPRVSIVARGRRHKRKLAILEDGWIIHPIFAQGPRRTWDWIKPPGQAGGMKPGFFTDPCIEAAPDVRDRLLKAMAETARKITAP